MAIFNSYVKLPEGTWSDAGDPWGTPLNSGLGNPVVLPWCFLVILRRKTWWMIDFTMFFLRDLTIELGTKVGFTDLICQNVGNVNLYPQIWGFGHHNLVAKHGLALYKTVSWGLQWDPILLSLSPEGRGWDLGWIGYSIYIYIRVCLKIWYIPNDS